MIALFTSRASDRDCFGIRGADHDGGRFPRELCTGWRGRGSGAMASGGAVELDLPVRPRNSSCVGFRSLTDGRGGGTVGTGDGGSEEVTRTRRVGGCGPSRGRRIQYWKIGSSGG